MFRKRNVKYASQVKRTSCVKCALRHIRQTSHHCDQREQHHFERSEKHHIAAGDTSLRHTRLRLELFVKSDVIGIIRMDLISSEVLRRVF